MLMNFATFGTPYILNPGIVELMLFFSLYLNIRMIWSAPGKFFMDPGKSWIFISKRVGTLLFVVSTVSGRQMSLYLRHIVVLLTVQRFRPILTNGVLLLTYSLTCVSMSARWMVDSIVFVCITVGSVWQRCRISPPRFLAECRKRRLNQDSFVLLYFVLFALFELYLVCVFSCIILFVSISQVIGCEDLHCVWWAVKLYSISIYIVVARW